jgi:single-strand DNA-binding protein
MNSCTFSGRIGNDLVLKKTRDGVSALEFRLAVRRNKEETDWIRCVAYREKAEFINRYFKKGNFIEVRTKLRVDETDDTPKRYYHNFVVIEAEFGGSSNAKESDPESPEPEEPNLEEHTEVTYNGIASDDLPF